jgi:hypothetical protein
VSEPRYRCGLCGNLTRFDVYERKRTRSFYHFSVGGMLRVEEEEVLEREVDEVRCRWCNSAEHVQVLEDNERARAGPAPGPAGADGPSPQRGPTQGA